MKRFVVWAQAFAMGIGGPGLFLIAFLDSSFVSLPEINDILIVWMVTRHKSLLLYYAGMATLGSIAGCLVVYGIARKGGEALLRRRFKGDQVERATAAFRKYGVAAIIVPSMLPPPMPFKIFVLAAGVARMSVPSFVLSVGFGRGLRYLLEGLAAYYYGDAALAYMREHGNAVALWLTAAFGTGLAAYYWWHRRQRRAPGSV